MKSITAQTAYQIATEQVCDNDKELQSILDCIYIAAKCGMVGCFWRSSISEANIFELTNRNFVLTKEGPEYIISWKPI